MTPSNLSILPVNTQQQIEAVAKLASQIWHQHFTPIIGEAQVAYMLEHFQSAKAIQHQIAVEKFHYFSAQMDNQIVGYMAIILEPNQNRIMLSKLYVADKMRGTGVGKALLDYAEQMGQQTGKTSLWLTVNRNNHHTIKWYQRQGFSIIDEQQKDIGSGFVMDDYIMEKSLDQL